MSHELRTPLNAIIGFSEVMEKQMFGPIGGDKYVEYARDIHRSGQFLLDVISDILDMSKIEAGRVQLEVRRHNLRDIVEECLRIVSRRAQEGKVEIGQQVPAKPRRRSRQAGAQAGPDQPPRQCGQVHAGKRPGDDHRCAAEGGHAAITISDTGIGIPAARHREARPALRAGREPVHQDQGRLGPRPRDLEVAGRTPWRVARHRQRGEPRNHRDRALLP